MRKRKTVDGRAYFSADNWATLLRRPARGKPRRITARDPVRFLAVAQSSGGPA